MDIHLTHDPDLPPSTVRIPLGIDRALWEALAESRFLVVRSDRVDDDAIGLSSDIARSLLTWEQFRRERN